MLAVQTTKFSLQKSAAAVVMTVALLASGCCTTCSRPVQTCAPPCGPESCGTTPGCTPENYPISGLESNCTPEGCGPQGYAAGTPMNGGCCTAGGCVDGSAGGLCLTGYNGSGCDVPRELRKTALPEYRIEPPDVLLIEAANNLRPVDAPVGAGESLIIQVNRTLPTLETEDPVSQNFKTIDGPYIIGTDGYVNLGPEYGKVLCAGQPMPEIQRRIETHLNRILKNPQVLVTLPDPSAKQIVAGEHLVRPDGTVGLGVYGGVFVAGKTLREAKKAIESHLSQYMHAPEIAIDVLGYNSKVYYVIADGGGAGEQVHRLPCTGNETVLDAISQIQGLPTVANKGQIWIARPSGQCHGIDQVLHVDWDAIAQGGQADTNYQILPGDRLYVKADCLIVFDTHVAKIMAPLERVLGLALLGRVFSNNSF